MKNFLKNLILKKQTDLKESKAFGEKAKLTSVQDEFDGQKENEMIFTSNVTEQNFELMIEISVFNASNGKDVSVNGNSLVIYRNQEYQIDFFALLNPHGLSGKEISSVLVVFLQNYVSENARKIFKLKDGAEVENFLKLMISKANSDLLNNGIDLNFSGTALTCLLLFRSTAYMAWMGNSRAVVYREINPDRKFAIELTIDHVPENREERYRIFEHGGLIQRLSVKGKEQGPLRVWEGRIENGPGLHITRSLGDTKATKLGVISEPEVQHFKLKSWDKFIVLATENVWAILHSTQMAHYVKKLKEKKSHKFSEFSKMIIKRVKKIWENVAKSPEFDLKIDKTTFDPSDSVLLIISLHD